MNKRQLRAFDFRMANFLLLVLNGFCNQIILA